MDQITTLDRNLVKFLSGEMREEVKRLGVEGIGVSDCIAERDSAEYSENLIYAEYSACDDISILVSSESASYEGKPIKVVLVPQTFKEPVMHDSCNNSLAVNFAYTYEDGWIIPTSFTSPLAIDGLSILLHESQYKGPMHLPVHGPKLQRLSFDKLRTKGIMQKAGIKIPRYHRIVNTDIADLNRTLHDFLQANEVSDFAVKANNSGQGKDIRMFDATQIRQAETYILRLIADGHVAYLDERIMPLRWIGEDGKRRDWNIRTLVTLAEMPEYLDGLIRHAVMSQDPVNISKGCDVALMEDILNKATIEQVKNASVAVAKAMYKAAIRLGEKPTGFLGIDLIVSRDGIYLLEANTNAGGFSELMLLRKSKLPSVQRMVDNLGPFLADNHQRHERINGSVSYSPFVPPPIRYVILGNSLKKVNRRKAAETAYRHALLKDVKNDLAHFNLGFLLLEQDRFSEAVCEFEMILASTPGDYKAWINLGLAYTGLKDYDKAISAFQESVRIEPGKATTHLFFGAVLEKFKQQDDAKAQYLEAIRLKPDYTRAYVRLAELLISEKDYSTAFRVLRKAEKLSPDEAAIHFNLGYLLTKRNRFAEAIRSYTRCVELDKTNHTAYIALSRAYFKRRDYGSS